MISDKGQIEKLKVLKKKADKLSTASDVCAIIVTVLGFLALMALFGGLSTLAMILGFIIIPILITDVILMARYYKIMMFIHREQEK